ncbi:MAG TPA: hypothetical protein VGB87_00770 [Vicinamibacteria bacterium]
MLALVDRTIQPLEGRVDLAQTEVDLRAADPQDGALSFGGGQLGQSGARLGVAPEVAEGHADGPGHARVGPDRPYDLLPHRQGRGDPAGSGLSRRHTAQELCQED